ncbi:MAG: DUF697 domain-containing protein [Rubrobacter sp.]|nr:DUF697 domain-containing protein [Rubrobacter sp.]
MAVTGDLPEAEKLADLLGTGRGDTGRVEAVLTVAAGRVSLSGKAVEDPEEIPIPATLSEEIVLLELVPWIVGSLDEDHLVPLGRGYPIFRRAVCERIIHKNARQNGVIGLLPIPGADMPAITANQGRMVLGIAAVYGEEISLERARELLGVLAAGVGFRALARQILKLVPVAGWAASGAIGYAATLAVGRAAILYFEHGKKEPEPEQLSEIRRRARKKGGDFLARIRRL